MTGGQIAALVCAILLLLPGLCCLLFGFGLAYLPLLLVALALLALAGYLFSIAFRRRPPPAAGETLPPPE
jgi:hypothetical protein